MTLKLNLPYGQSDAPAPDTPTPTPTPTPDSGSSPSGTLKLNLPYNSNDKPAAPQSTTAPAFDQSDSPLWTALQKPTTSVSDLWDAAKLTGQGVGDYARVWGNQAIVPNLGDRILSTMPWSGGLEAEKAKTAAAEKDLGSFADVAKWQGQNYSAPGVVARVAGGGPLSSVANNPITQGVVIGGGGSIAGGETDPWKIAKNAATSALESKAGQAIGSVASGATSYIGNQAKQFSKQAQDEATAALNAADLPAWRAAMQKVANVQNIQGLHEAYKRGGDAVQQATDFANQTTGAVSNAYQNVADAMSKETTTGEWAKRGADYVLGHLTGGPTTAVASVAANEAANRVNKWADVRGSVDDALSRVTGYVNNATDPAAWRNAGASAARTIGGDYNAMMNRVNTLSPRAAIKAIPGSSLFGY